MKWSIQAAFAITLVLTLAPTISQAGPLPGSVYEIVYDLTGSTFERTGTPFMAGDGTWDLWGKGTSTNFGEAEVGVSPGSITLQFEDCGGAPCSTPSEARLASYNLELILNEFVLSETYVDMQGDAHGTFDGTSNINWSGPATDVHTDVLMEYCPAPSICALVDIDFYLIQTVSDETLGTLYFNTDPANPYDIYADWIMSSDDPGVSTLHLRGTVVPEPSTALLLGLGLIGLANQRRRR